MTSKFAVATFILTLALLLSCGGDDTVQIEQREGVTMDYEPTRADLVPLNVSVAQADDPWWFHDRFRFVGRMSTIGNILLIAEFDRYLDPGGSPKVMKAFRISYFNGSEWEELGTYEGEDVIQEMSVISSTPKMDFFWVDKGRSGSMRYLSFGRGTIIIDFKDIVAFQSYGDGEDFKRTYGCGDGRIEIRDTVFMGKMFHEFINVRLDEPWEGEGHPEFGAENRFTAFSQTSAGKTVIASVDMNAFNESIHNPFFAIFDGTQYSVAEGEMVTNYNADFRMHDEYGGYLPHFMQIYSGDSINVTLELWVNKDKWFNTSDGWAISGVWGNAVFWNRREKAFGIVEHYHNPEIDTLQLKGAYHEIIMERPKTDPDFEPTGEPVHIDSN